MKKFISTALVISMSIASVGSFAACSSDDAKLAQQVVDVVKQTYVDNAKETPNNYSVGGQIKYGDDFHVVNWSVVENNVADYVNIGEMNKDTKMVKVFVTMGEAAVEYTLRASVTVGNQTKSFDFKHTIPVGVKTDHKGDEADPYTVADAQRVANWLAKGQTFKDADGNHNAVYIKGYVTDAGAAGSFGYNNVYIADEATTAKADSLWLYSVNFNDVVTSSTRLALGDTVTVKGYIVDYNGAKEVSNGIVDGKKVYPVFTQYAKGVDVRTPEQKIDAALAKVNATMNVTAAGNTDLATSSEADVSFAWAVKEGTVGAVANGKLTVVALPAADATVVLTVTATSGTATKTKDVTVTVKAALAVTPTGTPVKFDFGTSVKYIKDTALTYESSIDLSQADNAAELAKIFPNATATVAYCWPGNGQGGAVEICKDGYLKMSSGKQNGQIKLTFANDVKFVSIKCLAWNTKEAATVKVNGSADYSVVKPSADKDLTVQAASAEAGVLTFELSTATKEVTIDFTKRVFVFEIIVYTVA